MAASLLHTTKLSSLYVSSARCCPPLRDVPSNRRRMHRRLLVPPGAAAGFSEPNDDGQSPEAASAHEREHPSVYLQGAHEASFMSQQSVRAMRPSKWLAATNELTKWIVAAVSLSILIMGRHTVQVPLAILGSIINVVICKALKIAINEQRPPSARKKDPGMPSSHAQSLGFLSVYFAVCMIAGNVISGAHGFGMVLVSIMTYPYQIIAGIAALALAVFMAWLRVHSGYHTAPQVLVGFALGSLFAVVWRQLVQLYALPAAQAHPQLCTALQVSTWSAVAVFATKELKKAPQQMHLLKQQLQS